jgi:transcriptional antiterminator RfaH
MHTLEHWYILYSKPAQEFRVRDQLARKGICAYLPLSPRPARWQQLKQRPFFPCYLFARLDLNHVSPDTIRWLPGLAGFVTFGDELAIIDDSVIAHIEHRLALLRQREHDPFQAGQQVKLPVGHPLAALDAVFEKSLSDKKRACILINVLGRLTRCEVAMADLEAAALSA